jgi:hypothetical protein
MNLTRSEREKITDSMLKIQSASGVLDEFDETRIPHVENVQNCLKDADKTLQQALRLSASKKHT